MADLRSRLAGPNRDSCATFKGWQLDGASNKIGIKLADAPEIHDALVELGTELVYVKSIDPNSGVCLSPPWFRQQKNTPANDAAAVDSMATVNPHWHTHRLAKALIDGINALYPWLYGVQTTTLTSVVTTGNYLLPLDCEGILDVQIEDFSPSKMLFQVSRLSFDAVNVDGKKYLRVMPFGVGGRPIEVKYKAKPVLPDPAVLSTTWASTGLPSSAEDLPILHAAYALISSAESSKTQTHSVEQSERNRFVQGGSANAASRAFKQQFDDRLITERRKLLSTNDGRIHRSLNG